MYFYHELRSQDESGCLYCEPESQQIHVWSMNEVGELTLLQTVKTPGQVQPMVLSHDKKHLYIGVRPNFRVVTYEIEEGLLRLSGDINSRYTGSFIP